MADPQIWYLQDGKIQSQAGKIFQHQQGPMLKFPPESDSVDNSCLCKYRYMRYYAFYQRVDQDGSQSLVFFEDLTPNDEGIIDYSTYLAPGHNWKFHSGPRYLGCHPAGSFELGRWLYVGLPYQQSSNVMLGNTTEPSPYYIYETQQAIRASLKCMIVCSYKCCNGQKGCGISIPRKSPDINTFLDPVCVADFYVTNLVKAIKENKSSLAQVTQIEGSRQCCVYQYQKKEQLKDCDNAIVRVHSQMRVLHNDDCQNYCDDCYSRLPGLAVSHAMQLARANQCVYWDLWVFQLSSCDPCAAIQKQPSLVIDYTNIPAQVLGKGGGLAPLSWHDPDKKFTYCSSSGGTVYQWQYRDNQAAVLAPPPNLTSNPCQDYCQGNNNPKTISDSLSGLGSNSIPQAQLPCNRPDPQSRQYLSFDFQYFNIYSLKISKADPDQPDQPNIDPCHPVYKLDPQSIGNKKLKWTQQHIHKLDYQIQRLGFLKGTQFKHFNKDSSKFYLVLPEGDDPPENPSDSRMKRFNPQGSNSFFIQDPSENLCDFLYQVYFTGCKCQDPCSDSCSTKTPYITGGCSKWAFKGRKSDQELEAAGVCTDKWAVSTHENTFTPQSSQLPGQFVYSVKSDKQDYCQALPQAPDKLLWYSVAKVVPKVQNAQLHHTVTWSHQNITFGLCQSDAQNFKEGWKATAQPSDSTLETHVQGELTIIEPGQACQIYYLKLLYIGADVASLPGCNVRQPYDYSDSALLDNKKINWSQKCVPLYRAVTYDKFTVTPVCSDSTVRNQFSHQRSTDIIPDRSLQLSDGWSVLQYWPPKDMGDLYFLEVLGFSILVPPQDLCQLYYYKLIQDKLVLDQSYQYSGSQQPQEPVQAIKWGQKCTYKFYVQMAYQQRWVQCTSNSESSQHSTPWLYKVQQFEDQTEASQIKTGWYNGRISTFKNVRPAQYDGNAYILAQCAGTYVQVRDGVWRCTPPPVNTQPPIARAAYRFPEHCGAKTTYYMYCSAQVEPYCSNSEVLGILKAATTGVSSDALQTGYYSSAVPDISSLLDIQQPLPCPVFYVEVTAVQRCNKPAPSDPSQCALHQGTVVRDITWQQQCLGDIQYQYKQITRTCSDSGTAITYDIDYSWTKGNYRQGSNILSGSITGFYNSPPQSGALHPINNQNPPAGCTIYYVYQLKKGSVCPVEIDNTVTIPSWQTGGYLTFDWQNCVIRWRNYRKLAWYQATPYCSDSEIITKFTGPSYTVVDYPVTTTVPAPAIGYRTAKNHTLPTVNSPGKACVLWYLAAYTDLYLRCGEQEPSLPDPSNSAPADPGFDWSGCSSIKIYHVYALQWYKKEVGCFKVPGSNPPRYERSLSPAGYVKKSCEVLSDSVSQDALSAVYPQPDNFPHYTKPYKECSGFLIGAYKHTLRCKPGGNCDYRDLTPLVVSDWDFLDACKVMPGVTGIGADYPMVSDPDYPQWTYPDLDSCPVFASGVVAQDNVYYVYLTDPQITAWYGSGWDPWACSDIYCGNATFDGNEFTFTPDPNDDWTMQSSNPIALGVVQQGCRVFVQLTTPALRADGRGLENKSVRFCVNCEEISAPQAQRVHISGIRYTFDTVVWATCIGTAKVNISETPPGGN